MTEVLNNINLELVKSTSNKAINGSFPIEKIINGEFNLSGSPMFSAEVGSEYTKFKFGSDEPGTLGGKGVQPSPLTYVLFGVMACYGSSLAAECAEEGLAIKDMKVRGKLSYDLGPVVTDVKTPIITGLKLEIISSTNLETQIKKAWAKCPAVYALQNPIPTEIVQVSK